MAPYRARNAVAKSVFPAGAAPALGHFVAFQEGRRSRAGPFALSPCFISITGCMGGSAVGDEVICRHLQNEPPVILPSTSRGLPVARKLVPADVSIRCDQLLSRRCPSGVKSGRSS